MDGIINDKIAAIDEVISNLRENFEKVFWEELEEVYSNIQYYERMALVWKAMQKKDQFIITVSALRDDLISSLAVTRAQLIGELNIERDAYVVFIGMKRERLISFIEV